MIGWADRHIEKLKAGETVQFRPRGHSMSGMIKSGQLCTVEPITDFTKIRLGDVVLCKVRNAQYLHLVVGKSDIELLISNNRGRINGWTSYSHVYGLLVKVED